MAEIQVFLPNRLDPGDLDDFVDFVFNGSKASTPELLIYSTADIDTIVRQVAALPA